MAARPDDPRHLSPSQRLEQLTSLLATGARRWAAIRADIAVLAAKLPPEESAQNPLDVSPQLSVHVPVRLTQAESTEGVEA